MPDQLVLHTMAYRTYTVCQAALQFLVIPIRGYWTSQVWEEQMACDNQSRHATGLLHAICWYVCR